MNADQRAAARARCDAVHSLWVPELVKPLRRALDALEAEIAARDADAAGHADLAAVWEGVLAKSEQERDELRIDIQDGMEKNERLLDQATSALKEAAELRAERDAQDAMSEVLAADLAKYREGHGKPCYYCGQPCDGMSGCPSKWPIGLPHADEPGVVKWHHAGCVVERLVEVERLRATNAVLLAACKAADDAFDNYCDNASDQVAFDRWYEAKERAAKMLQVAIAQAEAAEQSQP